MWSARHFLISHHSKGLRIYLKTVCNLWFHSIKSNISILKWLSNYSLSTNSLYACFICCILFTYLLYKDKWCSAKNNMKYADSIAFLKHTFKNYRIMTCIKLLLFVLIFLYSILLPRSVQIVQVYRKKNCHKSTILQRYPPDNYARIFILNIQQDN